MVSSLGAYGEQLAVDYLEKKHFIIRERNFRAYGGEIDIICQKNNTLIFVEVKARIGDWKGKPYEAVNPRKLVHLKRAADYYVLKNKERGLLRVDVVSIQLNPDKTISKILHFENVYF